MKKTLSAILCAALLLMCLPLGVFAEPAADARLLDGATLVTFGDSITAIGEWPQTVATDLNMVLVNSGIGGDTTVDGMNRFDRDVRSKNPDFVTIGFATNDFIRLSSAQSKVPLDDFRANLQYFIDEIKGMDAVPILIAAPFIRDSVYPETAQNYAADGGINAVLDTYIAVVRELAEQNDVGLIDIHALCDDYTQAEFLHADGVHLSAVGKAVYVQAIESYLTENFNQDPDAPRVPQPQRPEVEDGYWTKDAISFDPADWLILKQDSVVITNESDGAISFANTTGLWPEVHYSPRLDDMVAVPVAGSYLNVDFTAEAATNMMLYFNGATPTVGYDHDYIDFIPCLKKADPSLRLESVGDLSGGQTVKCTLKLSDIVPEEAIDEDGNVLISGFKVYVVGAAGKKITIRDFSVTKADPSTIPPEPVYEDTISLLPTEDGQVSQNQQKVSYTLEETGEFTIARATDSSLAWPSVAVRVDQTVDLSQTPYLHLSMKTSAGCANGYIYYKVNGGAEKNVQLSQIVNGDVYDFTTTMNTYINFANAIGELGEITVTKVVLSVYGNPGDALTWRALAFAKEVTGEEEPDPDAMIGDFNGNGRIDIEDAFTLYTAVSGQDKLSEQQKLLADVNGDGTINILDAFIVYLQAAGKIPSNRDGHLIINGVEVDDGGFVDVYSPRENFSYAYIPLTLVFKELGLDMTWETDTQLKITVDASVFVLDTQTNVLIREGDEQAYDWLIIKPCDTNTTCYVKNGEYIASSVRCEEFLLHVLGLRIERDIATNTVTLTSVAE